MDKTKTIQISDIGEVITGNTPPRKNPEYYGDYTLFIKPTDISKDSKYTYNPEECYSEIGYEKYKKTLIPQGATCVVTIGSIGEKLTKAHTDCFINQAMNAVIPNEKYDEDYVYYVLKYNLKQLKMFDSGTASGRENVSKSAFSSININILTKKDNQIKVGKILSNYDDLIENNNKRIKILEEMAQKIYKEWFVDFRFPGHETATFKQTELGDIPTNWEVANIEKYYNTSSGGTPSRKQFSYYDNGNINWIKTGELKNTFVIDTEVKITEKAIKNSSAQVFPTNTVTLAMYCGMGDISIMSKPMATNQACCVFLPKYDYLEYPFSYLFFCNITKEMINISFGAAQQNLSQEVIKAYIVKFPSKEILLDFNKIIKPVFENIKNLLYKNQTLKQMRDLLLPHLISGEIDVENLNIL